MVMSDGSGAERSHFSRQSMGFWLDEIRGDHDEALHGPLDVYVRYRTALGILELRDLRRELFTAAVEDPGFNVLLDLYVNTYRNRSVSFGDACMAALVPQTTALRAIHSMIDLGYMVRKDDPNDNRRKLIELTAKGDEVLSRYLDGVIGADRP